ncbi:hypothetical protein EB796_006826 [Bugula neritina]|uniref:Uncharacterized protein n=1 Tax=Bugula neritina TaxID=10212 RepID=A0A7J7KBD7_BUGNE|nr:hypothetical protein EB796_006826 [Bugula neritina]
MHVDITQPDHLSCWSEPLINLDWLFTPSNYITDTTKDRDFLPHCVINYRPFIIAVEPMNSVLLLVILCIMTVPAVIFTVWTVGQGCVLRH